MTDKQVIIDCKYKFQNNEKFEGKPYCTLHNELCEDLSFACDDNCQVYEDYKQLKRKENELEELRQYHNKCCQEFEKEKKDLIAKYNQLSTNFYNGDYCNTEHCSLLNAKEQECEELKKIIDEAKNSNIDLKSFLVGEAVQNEYEQQLDQLKVENEELKKKIKYMEEYIKTVENSRNEFEKESKFLKEEIQKL